MGQCEFAAMENYVIIATMIFIDHGRAFPLHEEFMLRNILDRMAGRLNEIQHKQLCSEVMEFKEAELPEFEPLATC